MKNSRSIISKIIAKYIISKKIISVVAKTIIIISKIGIIKDIIVRIGIK